MRKLLRSFEDLLSLVYPRLCLSCQYNTPPPDEHLCISCKATLPEAHFHELKENQFTDRFWGRVPLESAAALYLFTKESRVQNLLHQLKYNGKKEIGLILGEQFGVSLKHSPYFAGVQVIVPVPLHPKKLRTRGYNQSEYFAKGLSIAMKAPALANGLRRVVHAQSQTRKSREERLMNIRDAFAVNMPDALRGKHVLLVDDVLTTGATLETCAMEILKVPDVKLSMATIAMAIY